MASANHRRIFEIEIKSWEKWYRKGAADGERFYKPGKVFLLPKGTSFADKARWHLPAQRPPSWPAYKPWCCALPKDVDEQRRRRPGHPVYAECDTLADEQRRERADYAGQLADEKKQPAPPSNYKKTAQRHYWRTSGSGCRVRHVGTGETSGRWTLATRRPREADPFAINWGKPRRTPPVGLAPSKWRGSGPFEMWAWEAYCRTRSFHEPRLYDEALAA